LPVASSVKVATFKMPIVESDAIFDFARNKDEKAIDSAHAHRGTNPVVHGMFGRRTDAAIAI
jgi:hypothetical protein